MHYSLDSVRVLQFSGCCHKIVQEGGELDLNKFLALAYSLIKNCGFVQLGAPIYIVKVICVSRMCP